MLDIYNILLLFTFGMLFKYSENYPEEDTQSQITNFNTLRLVIYAELIYLLIITGICTFELIISIDNQNVEKIVIIALNLLAFIYWTIIFSYILSVYSSRQSMIAKEPNKIGIILSIIYLILVFIPVLFK